jgi:hypothetical protein
MGTLTISIMFSLLSCMHFWGGREFYEGGSSVRRPPMKWSDIAESLRNTSIQYAKVQKTRVQILRSYTFRALLNDVSTRYYHLTNCSV